MAWLNMEVVNRQLTIKIQLEEIEEKINATDAGYPIKHLKMAVRPFSLGTHTKKNKFRRDREIIVVQMSVDSPMTSVDQIIDRPTLAYPHPQSTPPFSRQAAWGKSLFQAVCYDDYSASSVKVCLYYTCENYRFLLYQLSSLSSASSSSSSTPNHHYHFIPSIFLVLQTNLYILQNIQARFQNCLRRFRHLPP